MIGRNHKLATGGVVSLGIAISYNTRHVPLQYAFTNVYTGIGSFTYEQLGMGLCFLIGAVAASTLPDIDSKSTKLNHMLPESLRRTSRHRGVCHSLIGWAIFSVILYALFWPLRHLTFVDIYAQQLCYGMIIGYLLHIIEDSFSRSGIVWLYPFTKCDYKIYQEYGSVSRPVKRFKNHVPIRHWWGRGYAVGSKGESKFARMIDAIGVLSLVWLVL